MLSAKIKVVDGAVAHEDSHVRIMSDRAESLTEPAASCEGIFQLRVSACLPRDKLLGMYRLNELSYRVVGEVWESND